MTEWLVFVGLLVRTLSVVLGVLIIEKMFKHEKSFATNVKSLDACPVHLIRACLDTGSGEA